MYEILNRRDVPTEACESVDVDVAQYLVNRQFQVFSDSDREMRLGVHVKAGIGVA